MTATMMNVTEAVTEAAPERPVVADAGAVVVAVVVGVVVGDDVGTGFTLGTPISGIPYSASMLSMRVTTSDCEVVEGTVIDAEMMTELLDPLEHVTF